MKRKKNKGGRSTPQPSGRPKISQSIWEFAGDFIRMGDTLEKRHSLLNAACSAWNLACNPPELREKQLRQYVKEYRKFNPSADEEELARVRSNMEKLIEQKLKMFPHDLRQIVGAQIINVGGQDRIEAVAATIG
jgi:hypothetical protein